MVRTKLRPQMSIKKFGERMTVVLGAAKTTQINTGDVKRRAYKGIRLKSDVEKDEDAMRCG